METVNVLVTHPFPQAIIEKLVAVSPDLNVTTREIKTAEEMDQAVSEVDVLYSSQMLPMPEAAPRLRWVQLHMAGIDTITEHPLYTQSEVMFTTTSGIHSPQMTEYVFALMLAFAHHVPRMLEDQAESRWTKGRWDRYVPNELYGATLGIIGYGSIGRHIARVAQGFGMRILAMKRNVRKLVDDQYTLPGTGDPAAELPDRLYPPEAMQSFLKECDYVVIAAPLTGTTRHLIDTTALAAMKPSAYLINVARGDLVDEAALVAALEQQKIAGAGLDVFNQEPLPEDSRLWKLPNVILSPHVSGFSPHYDDRATDVFAENLRRFISGEPLLNLVDRELDY